jgi:1-acyl-sn-glycerol-3-phosphate acyltransferase
MILNAFTYLLRGYLAFVFGVAFKSYYKRIQLKKLKEYFDHDGPMVLAVNHPNAFTDPIILARIAFRQTALYYLARGDAFKGKYISKFLRYIGIVPIFRIQDAGKEGLKKNDDTAKEVTAMIRDGKKLIIFVEGLCVWERRFRPVKKGVARMVLAAYDATKDERLIVLPIHLSYSDASKFRSDLFIETGEPLRVSAYGDLYKENPARAMFLFTQDVETRMRMLVPTLKSKENDVFVEQLQEIYKEQWIEENNLSTDNLENHQQYWNRIIAALNANDNNENIETLRIKTNEYYYDLRKHKVRDHLIRQYEKEGDTGFFYRLALFIINTPMFYLGKLLNMLPYYSTMLITRKIVKNVEFYSSFCIVLGIFIFQLYYFAGLWLLYLAFHDWQVLLLYTIVKLGFGWIGLQIMIPRKKLIGEIRLRSMFLKQPEKFKQWIEKRNSIISELKKLST